MGREVSPPLQPGSRTGRAAFVLRSVWGLVLSWHILPFPIPPAACRINPPSSAPPTHQDTSQPQSASCLGVLEDSPGTLNPGVTLGLAWKVRVTWLSWGLPGYLGVWFSSCRKGNPAGLGLGGPSLPAGDSAWEFQPTCSPYASWCLSHSPPHSATWPRPH